MTLDTNVIIAYLQGDEQVVEMLSHWKEEGRAIFISSIVLAETLAYPIITPADAELIRNFVAAAVSVPFDNVVAEIAASLRKKYGLKLPDAAIAATALQLRDPLVTRDRQFLKIKEINVLSI